MFEEYETFRSQLANLKAAMSTALETMTGKTPSGLEFLNSLVEKAGDLRAELDDVQMGRWSRDEYLDEMDRQLSDIEEVLLEEIAYREDTI